ncbi:hypothetical protein N9137_03255 [Pseudomonadales bacterium]|nr:hypothetical protein [Pseudomonadales bacterium]
MSTSDNQLPKKTIDLDSWWDKVCEDYPAISFESPESYVQRILMVAEEYINEVLNG